jgi:D-arabinose 5-phosphate isomerase GutQ
VSDDKTPDLRRLAERVLRIEADAILGVIPRVDERFERAVEMMRACTGRIVVTGIGKSGLVGRKIAATLARIDRIELAHVLEVPSLSETGFVNWSIRRLESVTY